MIIVGGSCLPHHLSLRPVHKNRSKFTRFVIEKRMKNENGRIDRDPRFVIVTTNVKHDNTNASRRSRDIPTIAKVLKRSGRVLVFVFRRGVVVVPYCFGPIAAAGRRQFIRVPCRYSSSPRWLSLKFTTQSRCFLAARLVICIRLPKNVGNRRTRLTERTPPPFVCY